MRGIFIMAIVGLGLLGGAGAVVFILSGEVEYDGNPAEMFGVEEESQNVVSEVKESTSSAGEGANGEMGQKTSQNSFNVQLPAALKTVEFGDSLADVSSEYDPAWEKKSGGKTSFAHYPAEQKREYYVFEFTDSGLHAVELRVKPGGDNELEKVYEKMKGKVNKRFGGKGDVDRRRWADDKMKAFLNKGTNYVSLRFVPRNQ